MRICKESLKKAMHDRKRLSCHVIYTCIKSVNKITKSSTVYSGMFIPKAWISTLYNEWTIKIRYHHLSVEILKTLAIKSSWTFSCRIVASLLEILVHVGYRFASFYRVVIFKPPLGIIECDIYLFSLFLTLWRKSSFHILE